MPALLDFLRTAVEHGASDVHLKLDRPPTFRFESKLVESESPPLTEPDLFAIADDLIPAHLKERFKRDNEVDFALHEDDIGRFRVNVFMSQGVPTVALRHVKTKVPTFEELNLPIVLKTLAMAPRGIILTAGATSCGKSSTLAAMIRHINAHRRVRIITIEDPIEYLFTDEKSLISQREVELDTHGFKPALKHVLRQDPDVIMVGEMRDPESFMAALSSSETGHLVLSTLHSDTASNAINRILDFFPADERDNIRMAIAANLRAIICQRLVPAEGGGMVPAVEILINTPLVTKLIEKNNLTKLPQAVETGRQDGMQSFDQAIYEMIQNKKIKESDGYHHASNPEAVKMKLQGIFIEDESSILEA